MTLHIVVCIKSVVREAPAGVAQRTLQNSEMNPFDRPALEAALQLRGHTGGSVTVVSMGPGSATAILSEAQAMGADRAVLVSDRLLAGSDTLVTARTLAAAVKRLEPYDFVFFGVRTSDSDTGQVGPQTASVLGIPFVSGVRKIERGEQGWAVDRTMDEWEERWVVKPPAAMTIHARAFAPRPVGLTGIARVYDQPTLERWSLDELGLSAQQVGLDGSPTRVAALHKVKRGRACRMITGEPGEQVDALVEQLISKGVMAS